MTSQTKVIFIFLNVYCSLLKGKEMSVPSLGEYGVWEIVDHELP